MSQPADFSYDLRQGFYVHIKRVGFDGESWDAGGLKIYSWNEMAEFIKAFELGESCDPAMPMHVHTERHLFLSGLDETDTRRAFYSLDLTNTVDENQKKLHIIDFWAVGEKIPTFGELKKSAVFCANKHGCDKCKHEKCLFDMDVRKDKLPAVVDYTTPATIRLLNKNRIVIKKSTGEQLYPDATGQAPEQLVNFFNTKITFNINQPWLNINR